MVKPTSGLSKSYCPKKNRMVAFAERPRVMSSDYGISFRHLSISKLDAFHHKFTVVMWRWFYRVYAMVGGAQRNLLIHCKQRYIGRS